MELCNQQVPYSNLFLTPLQVAIGVADRGLRPTIEAPDVPIPVQHIIDSCLAQDPCKRPNFVALVAQLKLVVSTVAAAEAHSEAAPSILSRVSQGLGMLQAGAAGSPMGTSGDRRTAVSGSRSGVPKGVRVKPVSETFGAAQASPRTPQMARSRSQASRECSSSVGPQPSAQRPSVSGGFNFGGLGALGAGSGSGSGAAHAIAGGAQAAAGKATALLTGFLNRNRPSPRH